MKAIDYLSSLIAGQKMGSSIPVQVCELEMLKTYLEIQQTMAEGRAALANAEQPVSINDDAFWSSAMKSINPISVDAEGLALWLDSFPRRWPELDQAAALLRAQAATAPQPAPKGEPVCHGCGIPAGDVHMKTCKSEKWPSRVSNGDTAAPAPQAQDWKKEPEYVPPLVKWAQEQPAQGEPVAWAIYDKRGGSKSIHWAEQHTDGNAEMYTAVPLYTAAPAPQAQDPACPECGAELLYECIACSHTNYPKKQDMKPQAQDKSDNYLNGYCTGRTDLLKEQAAPQPVHQGERAELIRRLLAIANTEANEVADALNEAADMLQSAQPKQEPLRELTEPQVHGIAHRKATRYTYIAKPSEVMYGFSETHIVDFVRAIEKAMG